VAEVRPIHESGFERQEGDFYPTPTWVTECLLGNVALRGPVWEPCCGDGAVARVLQAAGHEVVATDLVDRGFGRGGVDIFEMPQMPDGCRALVTNPPYGDGGARGRRGKASRQMLDFTEHAIRLARRADGQLALLVRLQWIAGKRVASLLSEGTVRSVIVLTRRITWFSRQGFTNAGQHHHAWIFFDFAEPPRPRPELIFAHGPGGQRGGMPDLGQEELPLLDTADDAID
jgi:hypothetical protein